MKYCQHCGSKMEDSMQFCSNCGAPAAEEPKTESISAENVVIHQNIQTAPQAEKTNGFAIAAFVCAIVSPILLFCCCTHFLTCTLAIIFAIVGLVQIRKNGGKGKGLAIAALIIAVFVLVSSVAFAGIMSKSGALDEFYSSYEKAYNDALNGGEINFDDFADYFENYNVG